MVDVVLIMSKTKRRKIGEDFCVERQKMHEDEPLRTATERLIHEHHLNDKVAMVERRWNWGVIIAAVIWMIGIFFHMYGLYASRQYVVQKHWMVKELRIF